jgi:hypothetical protein
MRITIAFSCGARSAFKLKGRDYLRNMLSRRQLQGFVMCAVDLRISLLHDCYTVFSRCHVENIRQIVITFRYMVNDAFHVI